MLRVARRRAAAVLPILFLLPSILCGQDQIQDRMFEGEACDYAGLPGFVWSGTESRHTVEEIVSYIAPVYWFSPDEPLLQGKKGAAIRMPEALPWEAKPDSPVVYYQVEEMIALAGASDRAYVPDTTDKANSMIDLSLVGALRIGYYAYFHAEAGLGAHDHDLEATEFKVVVLRSSGEYLREHSTIRCDEEMYILAVTRVTGKAHGIIWFWNVLNVDEETKFPMTLFIEEGKHAIGTDKNADGYFTPGYDVNTRVNDAWGTRDVISTWTLFSGGYQSYMTKVRYDDTRIFPPLPDDSPLTARVDSITTPGTYAVYELRPLPPASLAADDPHLYKFMSDKEVPDWPDIDQRSDLQGFVDWVEAGAAVKSLSIALRYSGDLGVTFVFPLFIVKNYEDPLSGGWLVWRMYLQDTDLRDFGAQLMYTPSASRWIDSYLATGVEWDVRNCVASNDPSGCPTDPAPGTTSTKAFFTLETGIKFRVNLGGSNLKFLTFFTDFWGLRIGVLNKGFPDITNLSYVLEFGAGSW